MYKYSGIDGFWVYRGSSTTEITYVFLFTTMYYYYYCCVVVLTLPTGMYYYGQYAVIEHGGPSSRSTWFDSKT